ncbi:MAG: hypothetical protein HGJ94_10715 [Desulfosarcina sp.]|nr:hypothetical protein [Desulfosarcina sp.]
MVARPLVLYLLEVQDIQLFIANRTLSKAEKLIDSHPRGSAQQLNVEDGGRLKMSSAIRMLLLVCCPGSTK